eukprot:gnl/TRDRNA2_/TRDRNA2_42010_c0_seq1.p1 gnl/TRDRNA2_/TRDRNA2_42010_c0~~gnl/TRDRNA2_/TRDRNA2_42010_c0_seq1.p1  ORF type:complete len:386 (-),score=49.99 gnl/TRDRNA2_/TRDRNA2_42010_c0_seq1:70-1227(-)
MVDQSVHVALAIAGWYLTSFSTLLLNKYLLGSIHISPSKLALVQMISTAIYGALKTLDKRSVLQALGLLAAKKVEPDLENPGLSPASCRGASEAVEEDTRPGCRAGFLQICLVGAMRFATVVLGLVSLKYIAASFTETIKASAPFFTVIIAFLMLGERTSPAAVLSLIPVAGGLCLTSFHEVSFNVIGFSAAISTNVIECVQNVFSKRLLARDYTASQLQFYTSITALFLQAPLILLSPADESPTTASPLPLVANATLVGAASPDSVVAPYSWQLDQRTIALLWIDGVLYHSQSVVAYVVMSHLSPVTVSVINTVKRAMLIWVSVLVFGNQVTTLSKVGTAICLLGALAYNYLRQTGGPPKEPAAPVGDTMKAILGSAKVEKADR